MNVDGPVLRDIHLPPAPWWPPAPGVWLVAALLALLAGSVAWWLWRHARRRPLRAALREVDRIARAWAVDRDAANVLDGASRLLRRVARRIDPAAASASGDAWRGFVHRYAPDEDTRATLDAFLGARYRAQPALDARVLLPALRAWCRRALRPGVRRPIAATGQVTLPATSKAAPA